MTKQEEEFEEENEDVEYGSTMEKLPSERQRRPNFSVHQTVRRSPAEMDSPELENYLKNFYLIDDSKKIQ